MIIFQRIRYKNILSTGDQWTTIDFEKNPETLIVGTNGAGKSTLLDALTFVLFDKPFRKINKARLVNTVNAKGLLVELNFRVGDTDYMIRRGIKPNKFEVYRDKELIDQDGSNRDYQAYLEKNVLKMNFKSFTQVVILGSSTFVPFMELAAAERRAIVEDLLDIEIFSRMNVLAKGRISGIQNDVLESQNLVRVLTERVDLHKKNLETLEAHQKAKVADNSERIKTTVADNESKIAALRKTTEEKVKSYGEQAETRVQTFLKENADRIAAFESENVTLNESVNSLMVKVDGIKEKLAKADEIRTLHDKLKTGIMESKANIGPHQKTLDFFTKNDSCPTCTQAIEPTFKKNIVDDNTAKIEAYQKAITGFEENLTKVVEKLALVEKALTMIRENEKTISTDRAKIGNNAANILHYQREQDRQVETIRHTAKSAIDTVTKETEALINLYNKQTQDTVAALQRETEDNDMTARIEETKATVQQSEGQYTLAQVQHEDKKNELTEYMAVIELLKDSGIKTQIVKQYLPVMNKYINEYMERMNFPAAFELDDEFNETIKSRHRDEFQYANFSEGEKQRINLSLLLTWRKIAQLRNSAATNLLILDEVFDSSLDEDGTEGFMAILKSLGHESNIFVISHKGDSLFERFNHVLEFYKEGNFSQLKDKMD